MKRRFLPFLAIMTIAGGAAAAALAQPHAVNGCGAIEPASLPASNRPGAARELVPGTPSSVLICRYNGLPTPAIDAAGYTLLGEQTLSGAQALKLARQLNKLPAIPAFFFCAANYYREATVYFRYRSGVGDDLTVTFANCEISDNGRRGRLGDPPEMNKLALGSKAFIRAHEATVTGSVVSCTGAGHTTCRPANGSVDVYAANGDLVATATVRDGTFRTLVTPGRDLVELQNGQQVWALTHVRRTTKVSFKLSHG
jgi:hypothetical protein